ncbi:hypothetical protein PHLGIDRAFT_450541 [Phlebiopsis gigantea 11061_1 CR5-6]|uniref:Uncharacterized protein n=1 Tax=Phlebiopsis gigantea (strain 11061_1 CR5-6) TaxID=745531 RepID=A0A0C3PK81_PHLG1|nr:hypothetical protein PHLGIDRAFT_450541 [Phlebiopsis gigantea 11061_1 CR5-6]
MQSIHPTEYKLLPSMHVISEIRAITDWSITAAIQYDNLANPHLFLKPPWNTSGLARHTIQFISAVRQSIGAQSVLMASGRRKLLLRVDRHPHHALRFSSLSVPQSNKYLLMRLLAVDLECVTSQSSLDRRNFAYRQEIHHVDLWVLDDPLLRRIAELTTVMLMLAIAWFDDRPGGANPENDEVEYVHLGSLRAIVCVNEQSKALLDELAPHLRFMAFWVACSLARVTVHEGSLEVAPGRMNYSEYEALLLRFVGSPYSWPNDELNMFALCVRGWLEGLESSTSYVPPHRLQQILVKIREVLELLVTTPEETSRYLVIGAGPNTRIGSAISSVAAPVYSPDAQTKLPPQLSATCYTPLHKPFAVWTS